MKVKQNQISKETILKFFWQTENKKLLSCFVDLYRNVEFNEDQMSPIVNQFIV